MRCDVLLWQDVCSRGKAMLRAMIQAAPSVGVECVVTGGPPTGSSQILMTWGLGHIGRRALIDGHIRNGGRVIAWDLGYWNRGAKSDPEQCYRVTIDHDHPWRLIKLEDPSRFAMTGIGLREDANPSGDVLFASMGKKSGKLYPGWQAKAIARVLRKYPGKHIRIRAKDKDGPSIESALMGKSVVVCRHSNVAIDACIAGVPVDCEDGIAYALYRDNPNPSREQRQEFLESVAWWQWKISEAGQAWRFLLKVLG